MTKHTPLPWHHSIAGYGQIRAADETTMICYFGNPTNNAINGKSPAQAFDEREANAGLIVRAVNSHEALIAERDQLRLALHAAYHYIHNLNANYQTPTHLMDMMSAALAKEGKTI